MNIALKRLGSRWKYQEGRAGLLALLACAALVAILGLAGIAGLLVAAADPAPIYDHALRLQQGAEAAAYTLEDLRSAQRRAGWFGFLYIAAALLVAMVGPAPLRHVIEDRGSLFAPPGTVPAWHIALVGVGTMFLAVLAWNHSGQPLRTDEATSFFNFGQRSLLVTLAFYDDPNNHILHSMLMRFSVLAFGPELWAIRLPALVSALLCVPALYLAGARLFGPVCGLFAALLFATSPYSVDLATNARGYPLLLLAFLLGLALLPDVHRRRPAAVALFVLLMALGAWTVPVMLFAFAFAMGILGFWAMQERNLPQLIFLSALVAATGLLVLLLYGPALVVTDVTGEGAARYALDPLERLDAQQRAMRLAGDVGKAWQQWTYPLGPPWSHALLALAALGLAWASMKSPARRGAVAGGLLGLAGATLLTAIPPLPWWSLPFLFPLLSLSVALGLAALADLLSADAGRDRAAMIIAVFLGISAALANLASAYPRDFPYTVGLSRGSCGELAFAETQSRLLFTTPSYTSPLRYHLARCGSDTEVEPASRIAAGPLSPQQDELVILSGPYHWDRRVDRAVSQRLGETGFRLADERRVGEASLQTYRRDSD